MSFPLQSNKNTQFKNPSSISLKANTESEKISSEKMKFAIPASISTLKVTPAKSEEALKVLNSIKTPSSTHPNAETESPLSSDKDPKQDRQFNLGILTKSPSKGPSGKKPIIKNPSIQEKKSDFTKFDLPSSIFKSPNPLITPNFLKPLNSNQKPIEKTQESPESSIKRPLFLLSPISDLNASPFVIDSNFQTPNPAKKTENQEKKTHPEINPAKRIFQEVIGEVVKDLKFEEDLEVKSDVKFFISDVSKKEVKEIDQLKEEITKKRRELQQKKEVNKTLTQKHVALEEEVKQTEVTSDFHRKKHSEYERKIKKSSKTYSQVLLPDFEEKEKELHMLGGNKNNISKILEKMKEENLEKTRRYEDKKKVLDEKKKENEELSLENEKIENLNQTIKHELSELKPENTEISLKYCWIEAQNENIQKKCRSYEDDIKRVQDEIKRLESDIKATKAQTLINTSNISALEEEISSVLSTSDRISSLYSPTSKLTSQFHSRSFKPRQKSIKSIHKQEFVTSNLLTLQKLSIYLLVVFLIIIIFK
jgi:hypothetical protein